MHAGHSHNSYKKMQDKAGPAAADRMNIVGGWKNPAMNWKRTMVAAPEHQLRSTTTMKVDSAMAPSKIKIPVVPRGPNDQKPGSGLPFEFDFSKTFKDPPKDRPGH